MSSKAHMPPVPKENQSPHGGSTKGEGQLDPKQAKGNVENRTVDPTKQGQSGGVSQNTHHQGYQQDR
ncbi:hypothetical protein ACE7GA_03120 [Roseomonas sp. CCTCC AB2023176]|uniref:hypothetical protein n=1 Tax=Roseomonas sp. CCTCC AB2023176 TaxID=3342640 RepID=UPI0035E01AAA